jgi:Bacterial SH3 domain
MFESPFLFFRAPVAESSPVYEHPDKASAIIAYVPQGAHENVAAGTGDWLLIRLPDGKVGFIPLGSVKQNSDDKFTGTSQ